MALSDIDEDIQELYSDLGVTVTYTQLAYPHPSSKTQTIVGMLGYGYVQFGNVDGYRTTFNTLASHFSDLREGDFLTMESVDYTVEDWIYSETKKRITLVLQKL